MERVQSSIFASLAAGGGLGLVLVINLTDPLESGNRIVFYLVFLMASLGLCGLAVGRLRPRRRKGPNRHRLWQRGATWAALSTAVVILLGEHLLNLGNGILLLGIGGVTEMFVWNRR